MLRWLSLGCWVGVCVLGSGGCFSDPGGGSDGGEGEESSSAADSTVGTTQGTSTTTSDVTSQSTTDPSTSDSTTDSTTTTDSTSTTDPTASSSVGITTDDPSMTDTGGLGCAIAPNDPPCSMCASMECCHELNACLMHEDCLCFWSCVLSEDPNGCLCPVKDEAWIQLEECLMNNCPACQLPD